MRKITASATGILVIATLIVLPLVGVWMKGDPVSRYTEFPPLTHYVEHAGFSLIAFAVVAAAALALFVPLAGFLFRAWRTRPDRRPASRFPAWGWFGITWTAVAWVLAWTRFGWAAPVQPFTFSPLWFGYIVVVNALTFRQRGACMMTAQPRYFLSLFPVSAAFWWYFEYLNRFVQNWYYVGIESMSPMQYFWMATLPFSTVLPAVLGTCELLDAVLGRPPQPSPAAPGSPAPRRIPVALLVTAGLGLAFLAVLPDILFPLLWLSPLFVISAARMLAGRSPLDIEPGDTTLRRVALLAAAALICGFFWEMWNFHSLARWIYAVPFVNRFHVFEMPILGYTDYLPFGIECALVGDAVRRWLRLF